MINVFRLLKGNQRDILSWMCSSLGGVHLSVHTSKNAMVRVRTTLYEVASMVTLSPLESFLPENQTPSLKFLDSFSYSIK